jgi:hypothetical protein
VHGATTFLFCCSLVLQLINAHSLFLLLPPIATHCYPLLPSTHPKARRGLGFFTLGAFFGYKFLKHKFSRISKFVCSYPS